MPAHGETPLTALQKAMETATEKDREDARAIAQRVSSIYRNLVRPLFDESELIDKILVCHAEIPLDLSGLREALCGERIKESTALCDILAIWRCTSAVSGEVTPGIQLFYRRK